ncbi:MAG: AI-2E family transporter, partial [Leadbetterella sp.]
HLEIFLIKLFKTSNTKAVKATIEKIENIIGEYIIGLLKVIIIVGVLNSICLYALGISNFLFFAFLAAFLILIPYVGIVIGSIFPILIAILTKDSYWYAAGVAISFYTIQFLEGNFITPYIVGNKISINPLISIISLLLFGMLWGIAGLVLALPMTAVLKIILDSSKSTNAWGYLLGDKEN